MKQTLLADLFADFADDLRVPGLLWQVVVLLAAIVAGALAARWLQRRYAARDGGPGAAPFNMEGLGRVIGPLVTVCLLTIARPLLQLWYHVNLIKVALPVFLSLGVIRFAFFLVRRVFARQGHANVTLLTFEKVFQLLAWLAVLLYVTGLWPDIFAFLDRTVLPFGKYQVSIAAILQAAVSVVILLMLALWAGAALEERLMRVSGVHSNLRAVIARMARALLIVVAVLASLSLVGIDLTVLSVFGGALGVGLGLGLQKIASNYVSGFIILLDRSLSMGDMITVDKFSGKVTHINTRYTVLQGLDGVESIVPNEMLVSGVVQNSSLSNTMLALSTTFAVAYDTDLDLLFPLLIEATAAVERVSAQKPPGASLKQFGDDSLVLSVGFWIEDPQNGASGVQQAVNLAIWRTLKQHGIAMPLPQREVRVVGAPAVLSETVASATPATPESA